MGKGKENLTSPLPFPPCPFPLFLAVFGGRVGQTFLSVLFALGLPATEKGQAGMPVLPEAKGGFW